jgi:hypothetical protein
MIESTWTSQTCTETVGVRACLLMLVAPLPVGPRAELTCFDVEDSRRLSIIRAGGGGAAAAVSAMNGMRVEMITLMERLAETERRVVAAELTASRSQATAEEMQRQLAVRDVQPPVHSAPTVTAAAPAWGGSGGTMPQGIGGLANTAWAAAQLIGALAASLRDVEQQQRA